ncbi:MAG TPA: type II toxin-antitoxin system ParD family antitoxin [Caulobacteraceae bacterium]|nr:type II toxin-antitoxin system ParD family antitoxin [Caulobacteraceae bacterium]
MATRNVNLTDTLDRFVEDRVTSGSYQNASEVVRAALRLLKERSDREAIKLERLRAAIQVGIDELDAGQGETVEWDQLDAWLAARGRRDPR